MRSHGARSRRPSGLARGCRLAAAVLLLVPLGAMVMPSAADAATLAGGLSLTIGPAGWDQSAPAARSDPSAQSAGSAGAAATAGTPAAKPCIGPSPSGLYGATLAFQVSSITPQLVTSDGPAALTVAGTMTNTGDYPLTELGYKYQRGDALVGEAAIRTEAARPCQPISVVDSGFVAVDDDLAVGASTTFRATVPIAGDATRTLAVTEPGVYPVMINFNSTVGLSSGELRARVGEVHLLLTVLSVPPAPVLPGTPDTGAGTGSATAATTHPPVPYSMVWTIVDRPHLGVGGIFLNDDLVKEISPGGRLYHLVTTMTSAPRVAGADTIAVDPELLDELDRMSRGYWVRTPPNTSQPALTPVTNGKPTPTGTSASSTEPAESSAPSTPATASGATGPSATGSSPTGSSAAASSATGSSPTGPSATGSSASGSSAAASDGEPEAIQPAGTVAGTGQEAAAAFLAQLRRIAATAAILVLPYSHPDAVALVRAGMSQYLSSSVYLGRAVAARVLGVPSTPDNKSTLINTLAFPVNGLADPATLSALAAVSDTGVILSAGGVSGLTAGSSVTTVPVSSGSGSLAALIPNSSLLADITPYLTSGVPADDATTVNLIAGVIAGQYFAGTAEPLLVVPAQSWVPNDDGVAAIGSLLATFSSEGVVAGTDLRTLAAGATGTAAVHYPAGAKAQELPPTLLRRVAAADASITSLRVSLTAVDGPDGGDPATVFDPLQESLTRVTSAALRDNHSFAEHVLSTVESSLRAMEAGVTVPSSGGSLTLASSSAPLRLTVRNSLPYDVRIRIVIGGGQRVGLTTTDPGIQDVPAGRSVPVTVRAHVARSGTFSITAQLMTVDGQRWGAPVTLQVNSRAYGGLTLALLIVAGSVLALMVVIRIVQRKRSRPDHGSGAEGSADGPGTADGPDPGGTPLTALDPPDETLKVPDGSRS